MTSILFITGTGTEVGKTYVASQIAQQLFASGVRVGVYKPVASGCRMVEGELVSDDAVALWEAAGRPLLLDAVCPQRFAAPLAPNVAAALEGKSVDVELLARGIEVWRDACDILLVEGAGGLMSPLADDYFNADLAMDLGCPVVIVAANRLGVINDTLQTAITASVYRDGLDVAGVVLNNVTRSTDESCLTNAEQLRRYLVPPLLAEVPFESECPPVDWTRLARPQRERPESIGR